MPTIKKIDITFIENDFNKFNLEEGIIYININSNKEGE